MSEINNVDILKHCEKISVEQYDGHFTLLRFTTNWRFCFGTITDWDCSVRDIIEKMAVGKTMDEAIVLGIKNNVNIDSILEAINSEKL